MKPVTFAAVSSLALALALSAAVPLQAQPAANAAAVPTLEQIFRAEPYRSEPAKDAAFSRSGRYVAWLWSPFGEPGADLWVHDTKTGKTARVTSPTVMAAFEAPEDMARFDRKLKQRNDEFAERQAREVAQQAYLRGDKVDLSQWEAARIEALKKELAEKKAKDDAQKAADKADADAEKQAMAALAARRAGKPVPAAAPASAASSPDKKEEGEKELWELRDELKKTLVRPTSTPVRPSSPGRARPTSWCSSTAAACTAGPSATRRPPRSSRRSASCASSATRRTTPVCCSPTRPACCAPASSSPACRSSTVS